MNDQEILLEGKRVCKTFGYGRSKVEAAIDLNFRFHEGEIVSIVGESGSGKTTLARMVLGLTKLGGGELLFRGKPRTMNNARARKAYWSEVQAVFQDPFSSFNLFYRVEELLKNCISLKEGRLTKVEQERRMREACSFVNLQYDELWNKHPFELSGGQMQRIMIARIFLLKPKLLIADEPTSMVDACSRATILEMLMKLKEENNMTIVFITHDIGLAYYVSDTIYIMEKGRIVEEGTAEEIIGKPKSEYTRKLLSDVPKLHMEWDLTI